MDNPLEDSSHIASHIAGSRHISHVRSWLLMLPMQAVLGALADMYEQGAGWLTALQGTGSSSIAKSLRV